MLKIFTQFGNAFSLAPVIGFLFLFCLSCNTKYSVKNLGEVGKMQDNENRYKHKSLRILENDLKLKIYTIRAVEGGHDAANFLSIRFEDDADYLRKKNHDSKVIPSHLTVFFEERNPKVNKLFIDKNKPDSANSFRLKRDSKNYNTNRKLLDRFKNLKINSIYANSEKPK